MRGDGPVRVPAHVPLIGTGLPLGVGVGLKREHYEALLADPTSVDFVEVHAENFMSAGGPNLALLDRIADTWPVSLHGVALSLGGEEPLDTEHLKRLARLIRRIEPASFSEHLAWSSHEDIYYNDLLPVAYDTPTLLRVVRHIDQTQEVLGRRILLENPSTYIEYGLTDWHEAEFITEIAHRTGCGILLDFNNLYVSAWNHGWQADEWLARIPCDLVGEIHLAGHSMVEDTAGETVLVDTHGEPVARDVLNLFERFVASAGMRPTLIERDNDVPAPAVLLAEVSHVRTLSQLGDN